jgi:hypothetical protein
VSSGPPPPGARISDDGKWWWDGSRWVPMPAGQMVAQTPGSPPGAPGGQMAAAPAYGAARTNSLAVASLVAGILAWVICPVIGAILAIVFGFMARNQIKATGEAGGGMAMAGIILGFAHIAVGIVVVFLWIVGFATFFAILSNLPTPTPTP